MNNIYYNSYIYVRDSVPIFLHTSIDTVHRCMSTRMALFE